MTLEFFGAVGCVTGSKHMITLQDDTKILLDCGMFQGMGKETEPLNRHFGFDPSEVTALVLSHAHVDHSGLIPRLVKEGFRGKIYCTEATYDLCEIMLRDSAKIQEYDVFYLNKKRKEQGKTLLQPLYTEEDVEFCLPMFEKKPFGQIFNVTSDVNCLFTDNGHILGSAAVYLKVNEGHEVIRLAFTGDIGRYGSPLLNDPQPFPQCDYLICESTYGDREHEKVEDTERLLLEIVRHTCVEKGGRLIIPAFSLGRTQEIVFHLNNLSLSGKLPKIKVFVDSPLSFNATNIVRDHVDLLNEKVRDVAKTDPDPFGFDCLNYITDVEDSKALNTNDDPCVIISASGMAEAGRIRHHIKHHIGDEKNTILMVGYAEPHSLGGQLRAGREEVRIHGEYHQVKAEVRVIDSYSAHGDHNEMVRYLSCQDKSAIRRTFLVHGDPDALEAWKKHLQAEGFKNIVIPAKGEHYIFDKL